MPDGLHSPIGPSSFDRAEKCTASVLGVDLLPPTPPSIFAVMGTLAHTMLERCLWDGCEPRDLLGLSHTEGDEEAVADEELCEIVQVALDWVRANVQPGESVSAEVRLTLPSEQRMFGTSDIIVMPVSFNDLIRVADLKAGWLDVPADSVQVGLYGLMAIYDLGWGGMLQEASEGRVLVETTIIQPRRRGSKLWKWTAGDLRNLEQRVLALAGRLDLNDLTYHYGSHCRFCRRLPSCAAIIEATEELVKTDLNHADPAVLDRLGAAMPAIKLHLAALEKALTKHLESGAELTSVKLVEKRAVRSWIDPELARAELERRGIDPYGPPSLLTPPQAEKALGAKAAVDLRKFITAKSSGLTIAPMDDPRPAVKRDTEKVDRARSKIAALQQGESE